MEKTVYILGIPSDLGQKKAGVALGPDAIRGAGLHAALTENQVPFEDLGNIAVPAKYTLTQEESIHYRTSIAHTSIEVAKKGQAITAKGGFALYLGGDHAMAIGTVAGSAMDRRLGLIWVDAHGDFNTEETTQSNNIHGMPLAINAGIGNPILTNILDKCPKVNPKDIVIIGARDLDREEKQLLKQHNITVYTAHDVEREGILTIIEKVKHQLAAVDAIHMSFDLDSINPKEAQGVGTPVVGGLTTREACTIMEEFHNTQKVISMDVTETNPLLDCQNETAHIAVNVILSMLAKKVAL